MMISEYFKMKLNRYGDIYYRREIQQLQLVQNVKV